MDSTKEKENTEEPNGGEKNDTNILMLEEKTGGYLPYLDIPVQTAQKETFPRKRIVLQIEGQHKKMKEHKGFPQLTLTEDDA